MRKYTLNAMASALALALALAVAPAEAQVPSYASPPLQRITYSAAGSLAVPQTAAGDAVCITGFASTTNHPAGIVRVKSVSISGIDTTAQEGVADLVVRSTLDTGGTSTTPTAIPHASTDSAAAATLAAYTAVPTPGTAVGTLAASNVFFNTATAGVGDHVNWTFDPQLLAQEPTLLSATQSLCIEFPNAFTTAGPTIQWRIEWTEQ